MVIKQGKSSKNKKTNKIALYFDFALLKRSSALKIPSPSTKNVSKKSRHTAYKKVHTLIKNRVYVETVSLHLSSSQCNTKYFVYIEIGK